MFRLLSVAMLAGGAASILLPAVFAFGFGMVLGTVLVAGLSYAIVAFATRKALD